MMNMTDPIADMLTRIRNGLGAGKDTVVIPASKMKVEIAKILKAEGYINNYKVEGEAAKDKTISIELKYGPDGQKVISGLKRISKPGLRHYSKAKNLQKVLGGLGVAIVSTPKELLTDRKARKENLGGEVLCYVY